MVCGRPRSLRGRRTAAAMREKPVHSDITDCAQGATLGLSLLPNCPRLSHISLRGLLPRSSWVAADIFRLRGIAAHLDSIRNAMGTGTTYYRELTRSVSENLATLRNDIPDVMKGFGDMARAASRDGVLDKKTKELIALALGVAAHCDACIGFHVQALVRLGATKAEVEETLAMAVYMGGGPSLMYSANAVAAFKEFSGAD
jgi:AhpD family alkylhydroperoxidase